MLLLALALLAGWGFWKYFPNDEKAIRKRLGRLALTTSITPQDSPFKRLSRSNQIRDFFSHDVEVSLERVSPGAPRYQGRAELIEWMKGALVTVRQFRIELLDIHVKLGEDRETATAYMTLLGEVNEQRNAISQELKMSLKKLDGDWVISFVEAIQTLE